MANRPDEYDYVHRWCTHCGQERLCFPLQARWKAHVLLTVITLGIWALAGLVMLLDHRRRPYRCMSCGRRTSGHAPNREQIIQFPTQRSPDDPRTESQSHNA